MLLTVFEKYIFLQSLGWGIANSLWQAALLFVIYQFATVTSKRLSALFRYNFGLMLLLASFAWFVSTIIQHYISIKNSGSQAIALSWLEVSENFSQSLQWLSVVYFMLLGAHLLVFVQKIKRIFSIKNCDLVKAPVDIRLFTEQTAFHLGIHKKVSIWISEKVGVPSVIGFFKPIILLPVATLSHLTTAQAEAVILHELAHIRRNDYLQNIAQSGIEMILFFNPFVKMLGNSIRQERENCCDDWVLNYRYNKHEYASALFALEQKRFATVQFALAATNGKKNLFNRVKRLFEGEPSVHFSYLQKIKLFSFSAITLAVIMCALPVASKKSTALQEKIEAHFFPLQAVAVKTSLPQLIFVDEKPVPPPIIKQKKAPVKKTPLPQSKEPRMETEYNTAMINEELLKQNQTLSLQEMAVHTANLETETQNKVFVKIEEEQSGLKEKCTYIIELNDNNGIAEIKPLIALKKAVKETPAKANVKTLPAKKAIAKKRTTT